MTEPTAPSTAPTTPAERYAVFRERRALAAVQPQGPLALVNTQWVGEEQTIWGVPGRWAPAPSGTSGLLVSATAADGIRVDGDLVDGLVDALTDLVGGGSIWLLTPKVGRPNAVDASEVAEAAPIAGLSQTTTATVSKEWAATRLVAPKTPA